MSEPKPKIGASHLMTPQEHYLVGSTPALSVDAPLSHWFIPEGVTRGLFTIAEVSEARQSVKWFRGLPYELGLQGLGLLPAGANYGVKAQELDLETGLTVTNPQVFSGKWDRETRILEPRENISERVVALVREHVPEYPWREEKREPEGQQGGSPENR